MKVLLLELLQWDETSVQCVDVLKQKLVFFIGKTRVFPEVFICFAAAVSTSVHGF